MTMEQLSFPFANRCYVSVWHENRQLEPVEAEEAATAAEIYQALNFRRQSQFNRPLALHFPDPAAQQPVWFGFGFEVEVIAVDMQGVVKKIYTMPPTREGSARFIQFFSNCSYALLAPAGFSRKWNLKEKESRMSLLSFAAMFQKKAI